MKITSAVIENTVTAKKYDTKTLALLGIALAYQVWPTAAVSKPTEGQPKPSMSVEQSMTSHDLEQIRQQPPLRSIK